MRLTNRFIRTFNIPYGDKYDNYSSGREDGYKKAKKEFEKELENQKSELIARGFIPDVTRFMCDGTTMCSDIPKQNNIPTGSKLCGYIEIDGTYHACSSCEHEKNIRQIIWNNDSFRERYFNTPAFFFDRMPRGMLQEEYFAMKDLGFVKISSFKDTPNEMIVFFYNNLTYKQTDLIYPR